jgi:hypothetical protein
MYRKRVIDIGSVACLPSSFHLDDYSRDPGQHHQKTQDDLGWPMHVPPLNTFQCLFALMMPVTLLQGASPKPVIMFPIRDYYGHREKGRAHGSVLTSTQHKQYQCVCREELKNHEGKQRNVASLPN